MTQVLASFISVLESSDLTLGGKLLKSIAKTIGLLNLAEKMGIIPPCPQELRPFILSNINSDGSGENKKKQS